MLPAGAKRFSEALTCMNRQVQKEDLFALSMNGPYGKTGIPELSQYFTHRIKKASSTLPLSIER